MFAALLAVLALALVLRVWAATHAYDFRHGSDADQYERLAARLFGGDGFGIPGSENPYDFAPGEPYFAAAVYWLIGDVDPPAARIGMALAGTLAVLVVFLLGRRLGGPLAGVIGAALAAVYPAAIFYTSLFSSEPLAMLTVGWRDPRVPVGERRRAHAVGVAAPGRAVRADRVPAARVPAPHRPVRAARARARRPPRRLPARRARRRRDRRRVRGRDRAVDDPRVERPRALRPGQHRRRQGALHRHLPAGRRDPRGRQAASPARDPRRPADPGGTAAPDPDEPVARPRRQPLPGPPARRGAAEGRAHEPRALRDAPAVRLRVDDGRQDRPHVARRGRPELHVRRLGLPLHRGRARAVRARTAGTTTPLGGPADRASARGHQLHRGTAAGRRPAQPSGDADRARARGCDVGRRSVEVPRSPIREGTGAWRKNS